MPPINSKVMFSLRSPICFLLLCSWSIAFSQSDWHKIYETSDAQMYIDTYSLATPSENKVFNILINFNFLEDDNDDLKSLVTLEKFYCGKNLRQSLSGQHFDQQMGKGNITFEYSKPTRWKTIARFDMYREAYKIACINHASNK